MATMNNIYNIVWVILQHTLPSKVYLSLKYKVIFGKWIDWRSPIAFTEKLQWLKIYGYKPMYSIMVDKVKAKHYVASIIGNEYIVPTLAVWDSVSEISIENLPDQFVLKTNHDSGTCIVCRSKNAFNIEDTKRLLGKKLRRNYYLMGRERPYKNVQKKVFAEAFLSCEGDLVDYKFFCFNGVPKVLKIDYDRDTKHHANYYDVEMNQLPFYKLSSKPDTPRFFAKPENYSKMLSLAEALSKDIPFVRVDFYNINGQIYFGEMTFFPSSGFEPLSSDEWDVKMGSWITLPQK